MFNKELLMGNTGGQQPVALTVDSHIAGLGGSYYGYALMAFGSLEPEPFWGNYVYLNELKYTNKRHITSCSLTDRSVDVMVYVSGYQDSPIRSGSSISGDLFGFAAKVGQTVYLTFDPPPDGYTPTR